jgi:hypothetical protein
LATVAHFFTSPVDYGIAGIRPGESRWISWGPWDPFKGGAVVITADPNTLVAGTDFHRPMALQVTDTFVHEYPISVTGGIIVTETHAGVWITNTGQWAIRYVGYNIAVIK